jgi:thiamine-phosphate pyrophosphorylase
MKPSTLPPVYAITDRELSGLSHLEQCERLIDGGAKLIQIREKSLPSDELFSEVTKCVTLTRKHGVRLLINDRVDIAVACETDGVHLGQTDMKVEDARRLLGNEKIIGLSTHNADEIRVALTTDADYIAIGPVFGTTTKENPDPILGIEGFKNLRGMISDRPVVAIGGITIENHKEVLSAGADSVAVISALYPMEGELDLSFFLLAL